MIHIYFATFPEAEFTLQFLKAKPLPSVLTTDFVSKPRATLYRFSGGLIQITGVGLEAIKKVYIKPTSLRLINLGICGTLVNHPPFSLCTIGSISYKNISYQLHKNGAHLLTVDNPLHCSLEGQKLKSFYDLVDMEGFGLVQKAFLEGKNIEIWKCVSDCIQSEESRHIKKRMPRLSKELGIFSLKLLEN